MAAAGSDPRTVDGDAQGPGTRARRPIDIGRIGIWTGVFDAHPAGAVLEAARQLEATGIRSLWIPETVGRDPFVLAAMILSATSDLTVATGIANIYARDPLTTSSCQQTLAEAHPRRFLLGLGVSHHHLVERVRKHVYAKPLAYMREYLADIDAAVYRSVAPVERPPRVIAALGPKMLETAAAQADGAHPYFTTPEHTAYARTVLGEGPFLAPEQMVVLERDPATARGIARKAMTAYLRAPNYQNNLVRLGFDASDWADPAAAPDHLVDAIVAWGGIDDVTARVQAHFDAGADHVCIQALRASTEVPLTDWKAIADALT